MDRTDSMVDGSYIPPAARPLNEFTMTTVGDDEVVLFDNERMTYHTLNKVAFDVWNECDGSQSVAEIADSIRIQPEFVTLGVHDLGDAGLLFGGPGTPIAKLDRRHLLKFASAGFGAMMIPAVLSITAPSSALAYCLEDIKPQLEPCICDAECANKCCCRLQDGRVICVDDPTVCSTNGGSCGG